MKKTLIMQLAKVMAKFEEIKTDKAVLTADGEIEVGVEVYVEGEDGEFVPAEDGEYETEDKIYVVAEGKVAEIKEKEKDEDAPVEEPVEIEEEMSANPKKERFDAVKMKYEASYQEIEANIYAALDAAGLWAYLIENGDDYAIVSVWEEDEKEHLYRYSISISEDGEVTLGEREEVKVEYVPEGKEAKEEAPAAEDEFDKDAKIAELEAELAAIKKPVEEPVNIKASAQEEDKSTYNKALKYFKK